MNFSELFRHSNSLCKYSPDGKHLANVIQYRLIIRDAKTLQITQLFTCLDTVQHIDWSPDSQYILCGMYKRALVQVWSLEVPEWSCKIDEGSAGLVEVSWSPDSRHILTTAEFHLRVSIWSLVNKQISYIKYPKACQQGMHFQESGQYLALAERRDCKDFVAIFDCESWQLVKHFATDTLDLGGLCWSPDGHVLAVWENSLTYKVLLYSLDGQLLSTYTTYDQALGVKTIAWSPTSQFLAIGSFDQRVRLINNITWKIITDFKHPDDIDKNRKEVVYKEVIAKPPLLHGEIDPPTGLLFGATSKYEVVTDNLRIPSVKPDLDKANPRLGVGMISFSVDNKYFFTRNDSMPTVLWIWDVRKLKRCAVLIQDLPIRSVEWDPTQPRLALATGSNKIYMWSPTGCLAVEIPAESEKFQVQKIKWQPTGESILMVGKEQFGVCYLSPPEKSDCATP